jgi:RNA polymerase sigma-70 factor (ECF subfamily)
MMQTALTLATLPSAAAAPRAADHSDERLIDGIVAGDRRAMEVLYARHHVRVYRFILRLVTNEASAEDLTSEVFLEIWRRAARFEGRSQVSTWILSIARYKAISAFRSRINDQIDDATLADIPDSVDQPDVALEKRSEATILQQCLTALSPAHREVIDLVYYHGRSIAEVANVTGATLNTVKTRMFHARKRLASLLGTHGLNAAA